MFVCSIVIVAMPEHLVSVYALCVCTNVNRLLVVSEYVTVSTVRYKSSKAGLIPVNAWVSPMSIQIERNYYHEHEH